MRIPTLRGAVGALFLTAALAMPAQAQTFVTFGGLETSGFNDGSAILGVSLSSSRVGWGFTAGITGLRYEAGEGAGEISANALLPSVGVQYMYGSRFGAASFSIGRSFTDGTGAGAVVGVPVSTSDDDTFVLAQWNYWGSGQPNARMGQIIASYSFDGEYLFTRARGGMKLGTAPAAVGLEGVLQGTSGAWTGQVGPTFMLNVTPRFSLTGSAGLRTSLSGGNDGSTGYARIEFAHVLPLGGR